MIMRVNDDHSMLQLCVQPHSSASRWCQPLKAPRVHRCPCQVGGKWRTLVSWEVPSENFPSHHLISRSPGRRGHDNGAKIIPVTLCLGLPTALSGPCAHKPMTASFALVLAVLTCAFYSYAPHAAVCSTPHTSAGLGLRC